MKKNKTRFIIITLLLVLIVLATLYFLTDVFKSEKQIFFKYLSKNVEYLDAFLESEEKEEIVKNAFQIEGDLEILDKSDYTFDLNVDVKNDTNANRSSADFTVSYMKQDMFNMQYLRNNDIHALNIDKITEQYLGVENNNLKDFFEKFGMDTTNIPDKIQAVDYNKLYEKYNEKLDQMKSKYILIVYGNLRSDQFLSEKSVSINIDDATYTADKYSLKMTEAEIYDLYQKIYETLYNDQENLQLIVDIANEANVSEEYTIESVKKLLEDNNKQIKEDIETKNLNDSTISFNIYYAENSILKTEMQHSDGDIIALTFLNSENSKDIIVESKSGEGFDNETFKISKVSSEQEAKYVFENNETSVETIWKPAGANNAVIDVVIKENGEEMAKGSFDYTELDSIEIAELNESNCVILNECTQEELSKIFTSIIMKFYMSSGLLGSDISALTY